MGLRGRSWRRANGLIRLGDDFLSGRGRTVVDGAATAVAAAAAAIMTAARIVAVAVAGVPTIGCIAVEITPIPFAATPAVPASGREQGKYATERSPMPAMVAAPIAARVRT